MTFPVELEPLIATILGAHRDWEARYPAYESDPTTGIDPEKIAAALGELVKRLHAGNYPHFHPLYAAQMLKAPHPAAVLGYLATMLVNPNNHALDGGRATAALEKEAIIELARAFGFEDGFLGHLTASGTIGNLEALWVARELCPDGVVAFSKDAHYTHSRACDLLRVKSAVVPVSPAGRIDVGALDALCKSTKVGTVVVTLGTTGFGAVDALDEVLALRDRHGFRVHADMAYGGYYRLLANEGGSFASFARSSEVDSLVVDPHKHGLQPYGSGAVLFRDGKVANLYQHDSPYTYFSSPEHHPGETTFECSRAGAAAAALWLTLKALPLEGNDGMRALLARCREGAVRFAAALENHPRFRLLVPPDLDIVTYFPREASTEAISAKTKAIFRRGEASPEAPLFLATLKVDAARFGALHPDVPIDGAEVVVLRSCLMRPEQSAWVPRIVEHLERADRG